MKADDRMIDLIELELLKVNGELVENFWNNAVIEVWGKYVRKDGNLIEGEWKIFRGI